MATSFSNKISQARLMVAGIRAHATDLAKTSLDEKYAAELEAIAKDAEALDTEQERLKSALKTCTQSSASPTSDRRAVTESYGRYL